MSLAVVVVQVGSVVKWPGYNAMRYVWHKRRKNKYWAHTMSSLRNSSIFKVNDESLLGIASLQCYIFVLHLPYFCPQSGLKHLSSIFSALDTPGQQSVFVPVKYGDKGRKDKYVIVVVQYVVKVVDVKYDRQNKIGMLCMLGL